MDQGEFQKVVLSGARIGGQLGLSGSKVTGTLAIDELQVGATALLGGNADFQGPVVFIFSKVGGNLELAGGTFQKTLNLTGTQITGELRLGSSRHAPARWLGDPMLILSNARTDAVQDLSDSWPNRLDLNGFTYRALGGLNAAEIDPMSGRRSSGSKAGSESSNLTLLRRITSLPQSFAIRGTPILPIRYCMLAESESVPSPYPGTTTYG